MTALLPHGFHRRYRVRFALVNQKGIESPYVYLLESSKGASHNVQFSASLSAWGDVSARSSLSIDNPPPAVLNLFKGDSIVKASFSIGYGEGRALLLLMEGTVCKSEMEVRRHKRRLHLSLENKNYEILKGRLFPSGSSLLSLLRTVLSESSAGELKTFRGLEKAVLPRALNVGGNLFDRLQFLSEVFQFQWFSIGRNYHLESFEALKTRAPSKTLDESELVSSPQVQGSEVSLHLFARADFLPGDVFNLRLSKPLFAESKGVDGLYVYALQTNKIIHEGVYHARSGRWLTKIVCQRKI